MRNLLITACFLAIFGGEARGDITVKDYKSKTGVRRPQYRRHDESVHSGLGRWIWVGEHRRQRTYLLRTATLGTGFGKLSPYY